MENEVKKPNIIMDASQIDMFQLCPERFRYRYVLNKGSAKPSKQLERGTIIHKGCEYYYTQMKNGKAHKDIIEDTRKVMLRAGFDSQLSVQELELDWIIECVETSLAHWECEDIGFEIIEVEQPFLYLLHEDEVFRFYVSGKIDLLVNWRTLKTEYLNLPIDHKSYDRDFPVKRTNNQFMNYSRAVNSNYLLVNRIGMQKSLDPSEKHKRLILSYDPEMLEAWRQNMIKVAYQYLDCVAGNSWPMNFTSCDKYNRLCEYHEVCDSSGEEAKFYKLNANYADIEPWDVTAILGTKKVKDDSETESHS